MIHFNYGETLYKRDGLKEMAEAYLKALPPEVDTLISRGSSGCAIATAMLLKSERKLYHASFRKPNEDAHANNYAGRTGSRGAIVDDFVSRGYTVKYLLEKADKDKLPIEAVMVHHWNDGSESGEVRTLFKHRKIKIILLRDA